MNRLLGGIDFSAAPNDKLSVFGRLTVGKFYNNQAADVPSGGLTSLSSSRRYGDDGVARFERFFINYKICSGLTLSLGRLPTVDGPPTHIYDGRSRLGSYPAQLYSTSLDGYALTYSPKIDDNQSLSFRYIFSPLTDLGHASQGSTQYKYYDTETPAGYTKAKEDERDLSSWMIDYTLTGSAVARNINVIYQDLNFENISVTNTLGFGFKRHTLYLELNDIADVWRNFLLLAKLDSYQFERCTNRWRKPSDRHADYNWHHN
ncbi:MAG: DUF3373 family protein [Chitinophagaceae bacterium]|nr:DUF3373 family protein [Oligoflexus sp.]